MKKALKAASIILAIATVICLAACSGTKKEDLSSWFNDEFSPAYDAFVLTDSGKENAPAPDISLLITSDKYINCVFDYIADGTKPDGAEITEEDGAYTYTEETFSQKVEFDEKTSSIRITKTMGSADEARTDFIAVFSERNGKYYIQYILPEFSEYYEVCFTADGGEIRHERLKEIPYTIFGEKIPDNFAKEN